MRVLVLGPAGTQKRAYIQAVRDLYLRHKHGLEPRNSHASEHALVECIEDGIRQLHDDHGTLSKRPHHITPFLDLPRRRSQLVRWSNATDRLLSSLGAFGTADSQVVFLLMHGEYYRRRQLFSCFSWDQLLRFAPDVIVTLIDDAYDIRTRINSAERRLPTRSEVTLDEVLLWRAAEINLGDELSHNLYLNPKSLGIRKVTGRLRQLFRAQPIRHYVVAIKHPPRTLVTGYRVVADFACTRIASLA